MIRDVEVRKAGKKGQGVFARREFKKGELIFRGRKGKTKAIQREYLRRQKVLVD